MIDSPKSKKKKNAVFECFIGTVVGKVSSGQIGPKSNIFAQN